MIFVDDFRKIEFSVKILYDTDGIMSKKKDNNKEKIGLKVFLRYCMQFIRHFLSILHDYMQYVSQFLNIIEWLHAIFIGIFDKILIIIHNDMN